MHYLVDNVSKNGYMLLNVGPKPDGEIPQQAKTSCSPSAHGSPSMVKPSTAHALAGHGEGPTQMLTKAGPFMEGPR